MTGARRGLGRAMAVALAEAGGRRGRGGTNEAGAGRDGSCHRAARPPRRGRANRRTAYPRVEALIRSAIDGLGGLHILVNNSGIAGVRPVAEMPPEEFRATIDVNLVGVFHGCRAAAAHLIAQRSGKIINIASVLGQVGLPGYAAYAASKGGVMGFTRALAAEWARHNIQVNALAPGWFVTDMNAQAFADPQIRERLLRDVPMRRPGRLEEIGPLLVYLAASASDFMTGQTVFLDGGHSAA